MTYNVFGGTLNLTQLQPTSDYYSAIEKHTTMDRRPTRERTVLPPLKLHFNHQYLLPVYHNTQDGQHVATVRVKDT